MACFIFMCYSDDKVLREDKFVLGRGDKVSMSSGMKTFFVSFFLSLLYGANLWAEELTGRVCDENRVPVDGVVVSVCTPRDEVVASTQTANDGSFLIRGVEAGTYVLYCKYVGYADYTAELRMSKGKRLDLGTVVMYAKGMQINEVAVTATRNVFTTDEQRIYPSDRQVETSGNGLDLLKKLPIPFLQVNPINRTVSSLDLLGSVALFINDIPAEANDVAVLDPKQIKRVDVIRNPGIKYGSNLAMVINFVLKQARNGVSLGVNTANSTQMTNGYNNVYAAYINKNSQLSINQSENYQNYSGQTSDDLRRYLLPNGIWHAVHTKSLSARTLSATHGTTLKYNLTRPDNYILQAQGNMNFQRNPKQNGTYLVDETGVNDYTYQTRSKDRYDLWALNLYYKKNLPHQQTVALNVVGTHINSRYDYLYAQEYDKVRTSYGIKGKKVSFIGEIKYCKGLKWGSLSSGLRSYYGNTRNNYIGGIDSETNMINANSTAYIQMDGRWKRFMGNISLALDEQYYTQDKEKYHKLSFTPQLNFNYSLSPSVSLGYQFNLASRLPSLAYLNNVTIQKDKWERRVGNPFLTPFNHIENRLNATWYKSNLYAMWSAVYASNRHAIMPTITRTEVDGRIFFDNGVYNQRDMNQLVLMAYLRYMAFNNKLVMSGSGNYNLFHARSNLYTNKRGFFSGNLALESYLGKLYLSASINSRYNSLFAETIWYNEYSSTFHVIYSWKALKVGLTWEQPFQQKGTNNRVETFNNVVRKVVRQSNPEVGNHVLFTLAWSMHYGIKSKVQETDLNNKDTEAGVLK